MLSILIPNYNYYVYPLVKELQEQCNNCGISFEIIVQDDCSDEEFVEKNLKINELKNCFFNRNNQNKGRSATRNLLAQTANYEGLLFLDADTFPSSKNFIYNCLAVLSPEKKVINGGVLYQDKKPEKKQLLRWIYGKKREALSTHKRNESHLSLLTLNFFIKKEIFNTVKFDESIPNLRHEDTLFSYQLKCNTISVFNIDNPVYHNGLESSEIFINKSLQSVENLDYLVRNNYLSSSYVKLYSYYIFLKKIKFTFIFSIFYKNFKGIIERNLTSGCPSLFLFDMYRLGYLCYLNKNS